MRGIRVNERRSGLEGQQVRSGVQHRVQTRKKEENGLVGQVAGSQSLGGERLRLR